MDEVILPAYATRIMRDVVTEKAESVYADVNPETFCIDPKEVERSITKKTKAIVAIHLYGNMCDMKWLREIADKHNVGLIENCAQYLGKDAGRNADYALFSFSITKDITCWKGGMLCSKAPLKIEPNGKKQSIQRLKLIAGLGIEQGSRVLNPTDYVKHRGYTPVNSTLSDFQLSVLDLQRKRLDEIFDSRRMNAKKYVKSLINVTPQKAGSATYFRFAFLTKDPHMLTKWCIINGITAGRMYSFALRDAPVASYLASHMIIVPVHHKLKGSVVERIIDVVNKKTSEMGYNASYKRR